MPSRLLEVGNTRKLIEVLRSYVSVETIQALELEIEVQTGKLFDLSMFHYRFAINQNRYDWRQRVSRLYYASYAASRGVRLFVNGHFSTDVTDHKKVGLLPNDFPNHARFSNKLEILREDRNSADYDQAARAFDLVLGTSESTELVRDFLRATKTYLSGRGLILRSGP